MLGLIDKSMNEFKKELEDLINRYSIENKCDMPDFLLAEMVVNFIKAVGDPIKKTLDWYSVDSICHPHEEKINKVVNVIQ